MSRITTPFSFHSTASEIIEGIDLTGKRAIVTGGASGIGIETARALPEARPAELADRLRLTRGAVSKVLDELEGKKWITRRTLEEDNRGQLLLLTQPGRRALPDLTELADGNDRRFFDCLDAKERATLVQLLRKLTEFHEILEVPVE